MGNAVDVSSRSRAAQDGSVRLEPSLRQRSTAQSAADYGTEPTGHAPKQDWLSFSTTGSQLDQGPLSALAAHDTHDGLPQITALKSKGVYLDDAAARAPAPNAAPISSAQRKEEDDLAKAIAASLAEAGGKTASRGGSSSYPSLAEATSSGTSFSSAQPTMKVSLKARLRE